MDFKELQLADKELFNTFLAGRKYRLSTYTFTSFYLWRNWDSSQWAIADDALCVKTIYHGHNQFVFPLSANAGNSLAAIERLIAEFDHGERPFTLVELDQDMLELIEAAWPNRFSVQNFTPGSNYIYLREDLASLRGRRFHAKRNHFNYFVKHNPEYRFVPITADILPACRQLLQSWAEQRGLENSEILLEYQGASDGLQNFNQLDWQGYAILLGEKVVAMCMGEQLNHNTMLVHLEKADINYPGAYQAINCLFARQCADEITFINRAEDMGDEGLRQSKLSYHPHKMENKYILRLER